MTNLVIHQQVLPSQVIASAFVEDQVVFTVKDVQDIQDVQDVQEGSTIKLLKSSATEFTQIDADECLKLYDGQTVYYSTCDKLYRMTSVITEVKTPFSGIQSVIAHPTESNWLIVAANCTDVKCQYYKSTKENEWHHLHPKLDVIACHWSRKSIICRDLLNVYIDARKIENVVDYFITRNFIVLVCKQGNKLAVEAAHMDNLMWRHYEINDSVIKVIEIGFNKLLIHTASKELYRISLDSSIVTKVMENVDSVQVLDLDYFVYISCKNHSYISYDNTDTFKPIAIPSLSSIMTSPFAFGQYSITNENSTFYSKDSGHSFKQILNSPHTAHYINYGSISIFQETMTNFLYFSDNYLSTPLKAIPLDEGNTIFNLTTFKSTPSGLRMFFSAQNQTSNDFNAFLLDFQPYLERECSVNDITIHNYDCILNERVVAYRRNKNVNCWLSKQHSMFIQSCGHTVDPEHYFNVPWGYLVLIFALFIGLIIGFISIKKRFTFTTPEQELLLENEE